MTYYLKPGVRVQDAVLAALHAARPDEVTLAALHDAVGVRSLAGKDAVNKALGPLVLKRLVVKVRHGVYVAAEEP